MYNIYEGYEDLLFCIFTSMLANDAMLHETIWELATGMDHGDSSLFPKYFNPKMKQGLLFRRFVIIQQWKKKAR